MRDLPLPPLPSGVGGRLPGEPKVRRDVCGGAVRPGRGGGEPRVQRRVPLQRMRRRPVRLHRQCPGLPLPALATYPIESVAIMHVDRYVIFE